jgi:6,7-dimethyl-8-ribityllumazine synthase
MQREIHQRDFDIDPEVAQQLRFAIIVSQFNEDVTGKMKGGAIDFLIGKGLPKENIETFWVPGAFELPLACQRIARAKQFDALVAIGCVIKGESDHYYYIAGEASRGIMDVMLESSVPIGFGLLTVTSLEQAVARSSGDKNKGKEAAEAALRMIAKFGR